MLSQIIQKARDDKIAEQLIKNSLDEVRFLALGDTDAVGSEGTSIDTYMRVEETDCLNSTFEEAITPPDPKLIVNSKIEKPRIARIMIAQSGAENTGMCATQYPRAFMRAAIAARETMAESMGIHALDLSSEAGALRGVSALSDTEAERLEAALAARRRLSEVEVAHLWRANQQHLDARTVAAAPSAPMMRMYTEKDAEIRETMMRQANKEGGFVDWAYTTTDKGGNMKQKQQQHVRAWYWDEEQGCVETKLLSSLQTGGSANENMWAIAHAFDSGGFGKPLGHCSDSAGDVLSGLLALMLVSIPAYIALGCWLHILNLMISVPFVDTYGASEWGAPTLLRLVFMVHYLCLHAHEDLKREAEKEGKKSWGFLPHRGEVGRWWSIFKAVGDIYNDPDKYDFYIEFFAMMATTDTSQSSTGTSKSNPNPNPNLIVTLTLILPGKSSYKQLYGDWGKYLASKKIYEEAMVISCFSESFWCVHFNWFNGFPEWMLEKNGEPKLASAKKHRGLRFGGLPRHLVLMHRHLCDLLPNSGSDRSVEEDTVWSRWRQARSKLDTNMQETATAQLTSFLKGALSVLEKHGMPVLENYADAALGDPATEVPHRIAERLLYIYDHGDGADWSPPPIDDPTSVSIDGVEISLPELIGDMTQFATSGALQSRSVFFSCDATVALIRDFVESKSMCDKLALIVRKKVRPLPVISLQAEHDVHMVNLLSQCKSSNKGEVFTNAQATLRLNVISVEKLDAHDSYWKSEISEATKNMQGPE